MKNSKVWYDTAHESSLIIERQEDDKLLAKSIVDKWKSQGPDNKNLMSNSQIAGACIACKKDKCYADIMLYEEKVVKAEVPIICAAGTKLNTTSKTCVPICTGDKIYDVKTKKCKWTNTCTGEHQTLNETDGKCICAKGYKILNIAGVSSCIKAQETKLGDTASEASSGGSISTGLLIALLLIALLIILCIIYFCCCMGPWMVFDLQGFNESTADAIFVAEWDLRANEFVQTERDYSKGEVRNFIYK